LNKENASYKFGRLADDISNDSLKASVGYGH